MSIETLVADLRQRSERVVPFHHWDPYILGTESVLRKESLSAGDVATREEERWSRGRFPSLPIAIADAIFSKQRKYLSAVETMTRPFAQSFGTTSSDDLVQLGWEGMYSRVFDAEPRTSGHTRPHHLTPEGRICSIHTALNKFVSCDAADIEAARSWAREPNTQAELTQLLYGVPGIKDAMVQNIRMNLGALILKLDVHVRRVLSPHFGLHADAPAHLFEGCLSEVAERIPWTSFQIDQIIWYTESVACATGSFVSAPPIDFGGHDTSPSEKETEPSTRSVMDLTARVRRLSKSGEQLYIQFSREELSRAGLQHGEPVRVDVAGACVTGIVKTSGSTPWLAPGPNTSNALITRALRLANLEHGLDVAGTVAVAASA